MDGELKLSAAVLFVQELQRSTDFYRDVLELGTEIVTDDAALLSAESGDHIVLRALARAQRMTANVGLQYLIWTARDADDLVRCEQALKDRDAFVAKTVEQGITVVEGHDPDNIPVLLVYPASPRAGLTAIPARTYAY